MASQKFYLDDQGLIRVLQNISNGINQKTTSKITFTNTEDPNTGEVTETLNNPNNFATVGAVYDYVAKQSRKSLIINRQSAVPNDSDGYDIQNESLEYNGGETAQINLNLIQFTDIQQLFI